MKIEDDEHFMRAAIAEARKGLGRTSPNPAVGAVLVRGGKILARGFHRRAGLPHAEVECLRRAKPADRRNATLYVTLEPCSSTGKTPPCTEAIVRAGVKTVVLGAVDPNPLHSGRAPELLRAAGVEVRSAILAADCAALNEA
ncbi:MAG: bifunctional diaminohydroxyphosphoribosylaminopyrimidine deaminase/5-amino-6-(5-phosphoribosylamino)uracil reductase RibD, partial [Chthoniobacterales bacterium]